MITAIGIGTDTTIRHFCDTAARFGAVVQLIDLLDVVAGNWEIRLPPDHRSWVSARVPTRRHLDPEDAYYCRLIDLSGVDSTQSVTWRTVIAAFSGWLELCAGPVVNRPGHVNDNACKPLHEARLAGMGFSVPPTFTGSCREALMAFTAEGRTVAKALSGQRADCRPVTTADFVDYDERSGPVHLQRFVNGDDVRAHVIGNRVIAVRIRSDGPDYRLDHTASFEPCSLSDDLTARLRHASSRFGLTFAGWDLRINDCDCWVLEVNPMPGYSFYDTRLDGSITRALIDHLYDGNIGERL